MADPRYPYTYACDYIRQFGGYGERGTNLSRADASQIRGAIAKAIGMDDAELARKLADYSQQNKDQLADDAARKLTIAYGFATPPKNEG